jgi:hypothetical protein
MPDRPSMHRRLRQVLVPGLLVLLSVSSFASAQSGGGTLGPVGGAVATAQYMLNQTLNSTAPPGNGTSPPGNGTSPPGNGTSPPGNGTNPPGNGTNPPGNGTNPPGNGTNPPEGNETVPPEENETVPPEENEAAPPDGNETVPPENETAPPQNETAPPANETSDPPANDTAGTGDGSAVPPADDGGDTTCTVACEDSDANATLADGRSRDYCQGLCDRSAPGRIQRVPGFPWMPLLITLLVGPLVGLVGARYAIKRWESAKKPSKAKPEVESLSSGGPSNVHDPMRQFLKDVEEWKKMPQPS